ncbi:prolyl oligopeptidase family serine peptidase [Paucibacter sp. R3-3]|uniref:Prolyl oligopeptidase family serine peptidase n=1 Tax=Roseateles agri TaxID=3098619 RepID=A0ABU5DK22_9BURK|nr:prolyl oligopeptidase family serine peptidase [Paucibacter sp. R3-3]MDY0746644.1 prolyl oligopeptidase family serine peptidase [Paucibacter sp. R3-3]
MNTHAILATLAATLSLLLPSSKAASMPDSTPDPYLWLEDVQGERALDWVRQHNTTSTRVLQGGTDYAPLRQDLLKVLNARDRIPVVSRRGPWFYNLWQDENHKRGLWRRATLVEYRKPEPAWETVLDLDALGAAEQESWVFHGANCLAPDYRRCLVSLSRGGADAHFVREFDSVTKTFVDDKGGKGFVLPEAKSEVEWLDADHIYVGTDFGPGSMTDSGYPRVIKLWQRGTPLSEAKTVFEGKAADVSVSVQVDRTPGAERTIFSRALDFYNSERFLLGADGTTLQRLDMPSDMHAQFWGQRLLLHPRSDWTIGKKRYPSGSLLLADAAAYLRGERKFTVLFTPTKTRSLDDYALTRDQLILNVSENVASRLEQWSFASVKPAHRKIAAPFPGKLSLASLYDSELAQDELADRYLVNYADFLTPDTLYLARAGADDTREKLKSREPQFDATGMKVEQRFATSKDGTKVPYFVLWPAGAKADGANPTLLYGYGGFEISMAPAYSGGRGLGWLGRGGVLVIANIRGGGEFGPAWHQAAVKAHKQRSYDDFIAVAQDLIKRKISSPKHLGIMGGSNGGLLVGATLVQRPDLFNAVVCQVPLLDMRRYHKLLAGASWMAEYGDPDQPAEWAWISKYSPYQNAKGGVKYPKVLFTTSTRDDRVHPGHARKMAALLESQGHDLLYYENIEGGHGGAADNEQRATMQALEYSFLWQQLGR